MADEDHFDDGENNDNGRQQPADKKAIQIILNSGAKPFLDIAGIARIRRKTTDKDEPCWPVQSHRTRAWIAKSY